MNLPISAAILPTESQESGGVHLHTMLNPSEVSPLASLLFSWLLSEESQGAPAVVLGACLGASNCEEEPQRTGLFSSQAKPERERSTLTQGNLSEHSSLKHV